MRHVCNLDRWLKAPAQKLPVLDTYEGIRAHPAGDFVLEQLQTGVRPEQVVAALLEKYLVSATPQRVVAYRLYRERRGDYWTADHLERKHWDFLYRQVSAQYSLAYIRRFASKVRRARAQPVVQVRVSLCEQVGIPEELVPMAALTKFFGIHEKHAKL